MSSVRHRSPESEVWDAARLIGCPSCGVKAKSECTLGADDTRYLHEQRIYAAGKAEGAREEREAWRAEREAYLASADKLLTEMRFRLWAALRRAQDG